MPTTVITPPTGYPVTLEEAKEHLNVMHNDDDAKIARYISSATDKIEGRTGRSLLTQTIDLYLDEFTDLIILPSAPVASVTSIKYLAVESNSPDLLTLATTVYQANLISTPPTIKLALDQSWPDTRDVENAVVVRYVSGYGVAAAVPDNFKSALLLAVEALYYRSRDPFQQQYDSVLDDAIDALVLKDRIYFQPQ